MSDNTDKKKSEIKIIENGTITSVPGVLTSSCHCGIRKSKDDFSVIYVPGATACSGVFTTNKFAAAPVVVSRQQLAKNRNINAIIVNSGIANACTGALGIDNANQTLKLACEIFKDSRSKYTGFIHGKDWKAASA